MSPHFSRRVACQRISEPWLDEAVAGISGARAEYDECLDDQQER